LQQLKTLTPELVISYVENLFFVEQGYFLVKARNRKRVRGRTIITIVLRNLGYGVVKVGETLGLHHTTITHMSGQQLVKYDIELYEQVYNWAKQFDIKG
jgi:chromosomal replication initiation ATPase DnaA